MRAQAARLDNLFEFLDDLPEALYRRIVTLPHGNLKQRVNGILGWRAALLGGQLPDCARIGWPEPGVARPLLRRLEGLDLLPLCRNAPDLVDHILQDVCTAIETLEDWREAGLEGHFDDVLQQTLRRRERPSELAPEDEKPAEASGQEAAGETPRAQPQPVPDTGSSDVAPSGPSGGTSGPTVAAAEAPPDAEPGTEDAITGSEDPLSTRWAEFAEQWRGIAEMSAQLSARPGQGWDLGHGRGLQRADLRLILRYRRLLRAAPELARIVAELGRARGLKGNGPDPATVHPHSGTETAPGLVPVERPASVPMSHEGLARSDDIGRMLPGEAQLLGHPRLRMLWHARRAERALAVYAVRGVQSEHEPQWREVAVSPPPKPVPAAPGHGPVLVCLDSSASMAGTAGQLARAMALEALRLANAEDRPCLLARFSGPGELQWLPLRFDPTGYRALLRFLRADEQGGTDLRSAMEDVLERLQDPAWARADVLLITDGRFPPDADLSARLRQARKEQGLRVIGVQLGNWSDRALAPLCDAVHHFRDLRQWRTRLEAAHEENESDDE